MIASPTVYAIVVLYLLGCLVVGVLANRRATKGEESFYVADRSIGFGIGVWAMLGCFISASALMSELGYIVGWTGSGGSNGDAIWPLLLLILVAAPMRRFGKLTIGDFFAARFGEDARVLTNIVHFLLYFVFMVAQSFAVASLFSLLFGWPHWVAATVTVGVFVLYTALGGMYAAIWTDFFQGFLLWFVAIVAAFAGTMYLGGFMPWNIPALNQIAINQGLTDLLKTYSATYTWADGLGWTLIIGLGVAASPHILTRFYSAKDERTSMRMTSWVYVLIWSILFFGTISRMSARLIFPMGTIKPITWLPMLLLKTCPAWIAGLGIAGILSAVMSTVNNVILVMAGAVAHDLYPKMNKNSTEKQRVMASQIVVLAVGVITLLLVLKPPQFMFTVFAFYWGIIASSFFWPFYIGLHWPRLNKWGAIAGILGGVASNVAALAAGMRVPHNSLIAIPVSLVLTVGVSLLTQPPSAEVQAMTRRISLFYPGD